MAADLLLAVDAGGTKTTAWLVDAGNTATIQILGRGQSTGGNPLSVGFTEATRAISEAVAQAGGKAETPISSISRAILSIAGAADETVSNQLVEWAHAIGLARQVAVVSDFLPVLAAGSSNCCGVALICGTGSSAFARNAEGQTARCGGWGYLLGDEGSGYAIGRAALRHALQALESNSSLGPLDQKLLSTLGAQSISELTRAVYSNPNVRASIAALAPLIVASAENDDSIAGAILDSAARDLAGLAARAARLVAFTAGAVQIAASGGVLVQAQPLRDRLDVELRRLGLDCSIHIVEEPMQGCVRLARPEFAGTLVAWHGS